ncbi:MAG TPA: histone deacetylase [Desulfobulbus sp.]|nr:histone deacetylase [Desulfobulbus sp.]
MISQRQITVVTDPQYQLHDTGGGEHPETPERLQVIAKGLSNGPLVGHIDIVSPRPASRSELMTFHPESWLFRFEEAVLSGQTFIDHPDNQVGYESYTVALLSAGAGLGGVDLIEQGSGNSIFCATRPPGHHAEPARPYGFCFFNNCVIAARYWQNTYGRQRICVLDFDAHHGNGIQTAFQEDAEVLYISIHEHPSFSYPGTGWANEHGFGPGKGTLLNIPLSPGAGDHQVLDALDGPVLSLIDQFNPEAMVVAAGFDGHQLDDMSGLRYSTGLYEKIGRRLGSWSAQYCNSRLVSILEGGYHLPVLADCVESYLTGLQDIDIW